MISNPKTRSVAACFTRAPVSAPRLALEIGADSAEHLGNVGASAAARIEHVDVIGRQPVGDAEVIFESTVDAGDHVPYDLGRRVPDAKLLAQFRVERRQERLVEVLYRLAFVEPVEKGVLAPLGPVQPQSSQATRRGPMAEAYLGRTTAERAP